MLKIYYWKTWRSQYFDFLSSQNLSPVRFWGDTIEFQNFLLLLKSQKSRTKTVCDFSITLNLKRSSDVLMSKSWCNLLNKKINFHKNETELKMENFTHRFRKTNHVLHLIWKLQHKVKLWWVGTLERKKRAFFVPFILSEGNFF